MKSDDTAKKEEVDFNPYDFAKYDKFPKLPCRVLRTHVFHGVKEKDGVQTITCLSCGDVYDLHIDGRNKIEKSLWKLYEEHKDKTDLSPTPRKRPKKRWNLKYLIYRGGEQNKRVDSNKEPTRDITWISRSKKLMGMIIIAIMFAIIILIWVI